MAGTLGSLTVRSETLMLPSTKMIRLGHRQSVVFGLHSPCVDASVRVTGRSGRA